jgi:hypothetical protein
LQSSISQREAEKLQKGQHYSLPAVTVSASFSNFLVGESIPFCISASLNHSRLSWQECLPAITEQLAFAADVRQGS